MEKELRKYLDGTDSESQLDGHFRSGDGLVSFLPHMYHTLLHLFWATKNSRQTKNKPKKL